MQPETIPYQQNLMPTRCGRTIAVSRAASVNLRVAAPGLPPERAAAPPAVVRHCTVHHTFGLPPEITIALETER